MRLGLKPSRAVQKSTPQPMREFLDAYSTPWDNHPRKVGGVEVNPAPVPNRPEHPYVGVCYVGGLTVLIENLPGSVRKWAGGSTKMTAIYGEIAGTVGLDGDPVDAYVGSHPTSPKAWVIHQRQAHGESEGAYDEDKVMLGFLDQAEALACYAAHYTDPDKMIGGITEWQLSELSDAVYRGDFADGGRALTKAGMARPPGGGWGAIPGGRHGGYRRRRASGWEYWYPGQKAHTGGNTWEPDPDRSTDDLRPGDVVSVMGEGPYRWTPDHPGGSGGAHTWVTDLETGSHREVPRAALHPMRHAVKRAPPPPPKRARKPAPAAPGRPEGRRIKPFPGSQAKPGTVLHELEHGAYLEAKYKSGEGDRYRTGVHVPPEKQAELLREFRPLILGAVKKIARRYRIKTHDKHGPTVAYEELVAGAHTGLVMALTSYQGGAPFLSHAQRYAQVYAQAQARAELGAGVVIPDRTMRMIGGYLAATHRAAIRFGTEHPTPAQVAEVWVVRKRDAYTGELGKYVHEGVTIDQGDESVPVGPWRLKASTGEEVGKALPGKEQLATSLAEMVSAGKVEDGDWLVTHEEPRLPDRMAQVLPIEAALRMRTELDEVLEQLPENERRALEMDVGLHGIDGEPASALEIADALQISVGSEDQSRRRAVKKLLENATSHAVRIAEARRAGVAKWIERWRSPTDDRPEFRPVGPSHRDLLQRFRGDPERVRVYLAASRAGHGPEALRVLTEEAEGAGGEFGEEAGRQVRQIAMTQRDAERKEAFWRHARTQELEGTDIPTGTPGEADWLYGDQVETGYLTALAKRGA